MTQFRLADDFVDLFPDALIGLVHISGIDNRIAVEESAEILERQVRETAARLPDEDLASLPAIAPGVQPTPNSASSRRKRARPSRTSSGRPRPVGSGRSTRWSISTTASRSRINSRPEGKTSIGWSAMSSSPARPALNRFFRSAAPRRSHPRQGQSSTGMISASSAVAGTGARPTAPG